MMGWDQKEIKGYLVDTQTHQRLEFQYNPSSISDEKSTDYATIKIPGMSHPRYQYVCGEARRISFQLELFKGPVKQSVDWLRSLQYPQHSGSMLKQAPHLVLFIFGDLYRNLCCLVRQVKVNYFSQFDGQTLLPLRASVDLQLEEYVNASVSWSQVRS